MWRSGPSTPASQRLHLGPGDRVERGEGLIQQEHAACRPSGSGGRRPAGACRRRARPGRADSKPPSPRRSKWRAGPLPRLRPRGAREPRGERRRCRARRARAAAGRAGACRRSGASRASRSLVAADRDRARRGLTEAGDQLEQRGLAAARGPDDPEHLAGLASRSMPSITRSVTEGVRDAPKAISAPPRPLIVPGSRSSGPRRPRPECLREVSSACSLRAHYRTGSKGQRRVVVVRYLSPLAREPPWVGGRSLASARRRPADPPAITLTKLSRCLVVQHSKAPSQ